MTKSETETLMAMFQHSAYPKKQEICQLAKSLSIGESQINRWFVAMRSKKKAEGMHFGSE